VTSLDLLSKYLLIMELHFDAMLYSNLGNGNSDAAMSNAYTGGRFPTPDLSAVRPLPTFY